MAERTVKVRLSAQVQEYVAAMDQAATATRETGTAGEKLTQQRADFQALGSAMVVVGGAITAVGVAALKTGIDYNSMQQSSRAALLTMLGSAEAVNEQMDKLDAFAKGSPFSKATFIQAQQQMLAFGIETKKVIPYLDAVQNAVAAAGGSNDSISGIVATMSKIQSSAKITAQDLNEFGNRGVNAAELIGSQMGMTGAEIREAITSGSLDATEALDALAAGMSENFAGAADNVKETFDGAMDRVKAAWRDFSSELARPLVDPEGGGALVDFLNGLADAMRQFEKLPEPVRDATTAVVGVTGAALLAGGTLLLAVPKIAEFKGALADLEITGGRAAGALGAIAPVAIALAAIPLAANLASWVDEMRGVTTGASDLEKQLRQAGAASSDLERGLTGGQMFRGLGMDSEIAANNLRTLNTSVGQLKATFDNSMLGEAMSIPFFGLGREAGNAQKQIEELDAAMASMVASGDTEGAADAYEYFAEKAEKAGWSTERIAEALPEYTDAVKNTAAPTRTSADLAAEAAAAYTDQANAAKAATDELFKLVDALMESNSVAQTAEGTNARYQKTLADVADYVAKAQEGIEGYSSSIDANTVEGSANREMLAGLAADSQSAALAILEQETATLGAEQATENYRARLEGGREALYDQIVALTGNTDAAKALTDQIYEIPPETNWKVIANTAAATNAVRSFVDEFDGKTITIYGQMAFKDGQNPSAALNHADGALYENGVKAFANSGFEPGIYPYTPGGIHKFAEEFGESYISLDPSRRNRSVGVWQETGERLGVMQGIRDAISAARGGGDTNINQTNYVTQVERDPRLLMRQFGRELKGAM